MKKVLVKVLLAAFALGATSMASAQNSKKDKPRGEHKMGDKGSSSHASKRLEMMKKDLNLSSEQEVKVKQVLEDEEKSLNADMANKTETSRDEMKTKMDAQKASTDAKLKASTDAKLKAILTEEQYKKYLEKDAEMRKNKPSGAPHMH